MVPAPRVRCPPPVTDDRPSELGEGDDGHLVPQPLCHHLLPEVVDRVVDHRHYAVARRVHRRVRVDTPRPHPEGRALHARRAARLDDARDGAQRHCKCTAAAPANIAAVVEGRRRCCRVNRIAECLRVLDRPPQHARVRLGEDRARGRGRQVLDVAPELLVLRKPADGASPRVDGEREAGPSCQCSRHGTRHGVQPGLVRRAAAAGARVALRVARRGVERAHHLPEYARLKLVV
mmetsp:Transcript_18934/g.62519  ORF Transcript_18934/g.62519 Transcript_18934/m.62519 type:complete len:234 (+) Transcript_18934:389-1090(+)